MASEYFVQSDIVHVRLFGAVDGYDIMRVHNEDDFIRLIRLHKNVVYDYSEATAIEFTLEDAKMFARLAIVETELTAELVIGVIPKDEEQAKGTLVYQQTANQGGARVFILDSAEQLPNLT